MASKLYVQFPSHIGDSTDGIYLGWFNVWTWSFPSAESGFKKTSLNDVRFTVGSRGNGVARLGNARDEHFEKVILDSVRPNAGMIYRLEFSDVVFSLFTVVHEQATFEFNFRSMKTIHYNFGGG